MLFRSGNSPLEILENPIPLEYLNWIITDLRFPNELERIKAEKGFTIRVYRNNVANTEHSELESETALNDYKLTYTIYNNGSIDELIQKLRTILIKHQLLPWTLL